MNDVFYQIHKPKILVVDDIIQNVELLKAFLLPMDYHIETSFDGEDALAKTESFQPDLILLDVMLPKVDGYEVCKKLKSDEKTRHIMIIMITALSELENELLGIEVGADDYLTKPFNRMLLGARIKSLLKTKYYNDQLEKAETVISSLALSVEAKDPYTEGHCERLSKYSMLLGQRLKLSPPYIKALNSGGILHDIGKIGISDTILLKQGPLDEKERKIMNKHSEIGENICKPLHSLKLVLPIIRHHHERLDGTGYPDGLKGDEIPVTARILQIVDIYDALITKRPYKPAFSQEKVFQIMDSEIDKGWWDKEIFDEFKEMTHNKDWTENPPIVKVQSE
ncbi:MAG: response regulator [Spirochaetota bacterium]|nr:response regulator [Spirochaetota bacterium]